MEFRITENAVISGSFVSGARRSTELMNAMKKVKPGQSINVPVDYQKDSKNRRAMIAVSCLRIWGKGNFAVRKQEDGSYEAFRIS